MHVGVDLACVDVALGLDHQGVGCLGRGAERFVTFVRQCQAWCRERRFHAARRRGQLASDGAPGFGVQGHGVTSVGQMSGQVHLAGLSGAEWSLFCPGIGVPADACAGLRVPSVLPSAGSVLSAFAGGKTDAADGTDVLGAGAVVAADSVGFGCSTIGIEGGGVVWSQATRHIALAQSAIRVNGVGMVFPCV